MTADRLFALLPAHVEARDHAAGGLLRALLAAVAEELEILERDLDDLYASWFIETCPEWVVPYLADLVGVADLPPDLTGAGGAGLSRRAFVANTLAYRRRKGTPAVIEQVARDATGWPARAVEYHRLLVAAAHVNHVRVDRPATARLRTPAAAGGPLELVPTGVGMGALDPLAHTADVRRIARGRGRYGIGNIGVFLFPDQVYESGWAPARPRGTDPADGWSVHPLRRDGPLYAVPEPERTIEHVATEADLPVPLRPRRLLALLRAARDTGGGELPLAVRVDGAELTPDRIRVCDLEDLAPGDDWQVMVDTRTGRVHPRRDRAAAHPGRMEVQFGYGATADVGAGTYDRAAVHADVLAADPYAGDETVLAQVAVTSRAELAGALAGIGRAAGGTYVVSIADSGVYPGDLAVTVPRGTRLVVVAASWTARSDGAEEVLGVYAPEGLRPQLAGTLTVTGEGGASVILDGLVVEGDVVVEDGALASLAVSQCTVAGRLTVGENAGVAARIVRSVGGGATFGTKAATLEIVDSVLDAGPAVVGPALELTVRAATVRGAVDVRTLTATSSILDGPLRVEHRQTGCARFSYLEPGARAPRRYRCTSAQPVYRSLDPGSPHHVALAAGCPVAVAEGGEDGSEMGVHHHLRRPVRLRAAGRLLAPYVPVGLEIGVAAPAATAGG